MRRRFSDEAKFYEMLEVVAYHDLFGTLCTGEASRVALINATGLRLKRVDAANRLLTYLVVANLADMYGTVGFISPRIAENVLNDWYYITKTLDSQEKRLSSKGDIEKVIIESEQEPERAIDRIRRMHLTAIYESRVVTEPHLRGLLAAKITEDVVRSALLKHLGPEVKDFCARFALVCKLDYAKRFITELSDRWIRKEMERLKFGQANSTDNSLIESVRMDILPPILVAILVRLVRCYYGDPSSSNTDAKRIGIELMGLIRSQKIVDRVIGLLLSDSSSEGVNWIADEATAFYFL